MRSCLLPGLVCALTVLLTSVPAMASSGSGGLEKVHVRARREKDPELRAQLLMDLGEACQGQGCSLDLPAILQDAQAAVEATPLPERQLELWLRLALLQQRLGATDLAQQALQQARRTAASAKAAQREALLLRIGLASTELGDHQLAEAVFAEAEQLRRAEAAGPTAFPFREEKLKGRVGLAVSAADYEETTANAVASFDLYKQWPRDDFEADFFASVNYDSSRDFNETWPIAQGYLIYRHHLDRTHFLFADQLMAINDSTFSTSNDDDDISVVAGTLFGYGFNFWQGADPSSYQALQIGIGPRYEYAEINLRRRRDQVDPVAALVYRARDAPIGPAKWSQVFSLAAPVDSFDEAYVWSSTRLDWPITKRWLWTNRLTVRYRTRPLEAGYQRFNVIFSTGLSYSF